MSQDLLLSKSHKMGQGIFATSKLLLQYFQRTFFFLIFPFLKGVQN